MSDHHTPGPTIASGTRRVFAIGQAVVDAALVGDRCGLCFGVRNDHAVDCLVREHLVHDEPTRRRLMADLGTEE